MEISGKINFIGELQKRVNADTGKSFTWREITIVSDESYYERTGAICNTVNEQLFQLVFTDAENFNLEQGTLVKLFYSSGVRIYEGKPYETKSIRRIQLAAPRTA